MLYIEPIDYLIKKFKNYNGNIEIFLDKEFDLFCRKYEVGGNQLKFILEKFFEGREIPLKYKKIMERL